MQANFGWDSVSLAATRFTGWPISAVICVSIFAACLAVVVVVHLRAVRKLLPGGQLYLRDWGRTSAAIVQFDADGLIEAANPQFCALFNLSEAEIVGRTFCRLFDTTDLPEKIPSILKSLSGRSESIEIDLQRLGYPNDAGRVKACIWPVRSEDGAVTGAVAVISNTEATKRYTSAASGELISEYQSIISHSFPGALCSYRQNADGSSKLIYASSNFEGVCGVPISEAGLGPAKCFRRVYEVDALRLMPSISAAASNMEPWFAEYRISHPLRGEVWVEERSTPVKQEDGSTVWHGVIFDITEKKKAERATLLNSERLANAIEIANLGFFDRDLLNGAEFVSRECKSIFGLAENSDVGYLDLLALVHTEDRNAFEQRCAVATSQAASCSLVGEHRIVRPDGVMRWVTVCSRTLFEQLDGESRATRVISCVVDITERLLSEENAGLWQKLFAGPNFGLAHLRLSDGAILAVNEVFASQRGYTAAELRGNKISVLSPPEYAESLEEQLQQVAATGHLVWETVHQRKDGTQFPVLKEAALVAGAEGEPPSVICYALDITKFKESEIALAKSRVLHQTTISSLREGVMTFDAEGRVLSCNPSAERILGLPFEDIRANRRDVSAWPAIREDGTAFDPHDFPVSKTLRTGQTCEGVVMGVPNLRRDKPDTTTRWLLVNSAPVEDPAVGQKRSAVVSFIDITARKEAEKRSELLLAEVRRAQTETQLQKSLFESMFDCAPDAIVLTDLNRRIKSVNQGFTRIFGYELSELEGQSTQTIYASIEDWETVGSHIDRCDTDKIMNGEFVQCRRKNGDAFPVRISGATLKDEDQRSVGYIAIVRDITQEREREQALEEAMRYESLGKLTSGIAHDFNNLLTVISINLQLISLAVPPQLVKRQVQSALLAASMGAKLNQRLTGLARKGALHAIPVNLNSIVRDISDVLRIAIGERSVISISLAPDLRLTKADPIEVENMLLNFAINSRDAMPTGGVLTIETFNSDAVGPDDNSEVLASGGYVVLKVRDTGHGMSADVLKHATERFYTTKTSGSGLGLSAVNHFVKQSGGRLSITSVEGEGTVIEVALPAFMPSGESLESKVVSGGGIKGQPRILVVEDNSAVLDAVSEYLQSLGYLVFLADDVASALQVLANQRDIDLVFTDLVLPGGRTGLDLGKEIAQTYPAVKVLYASGYVDETAGESEAAGRLLKKPYALDDLQFAIAEMLTS